MDDLKFICCIENVLSGTCDIYNIININTKDKLIKIARENQEATIPFDNIIDITVKDETPCFVIREDNL